MTDECRRRANKANAKASTGPRTAAGKARSARNAYRHGLNLPIASEPALLPAVEALAQRIAGPAADPARLDRARRIAEADAQLRRVRGYKLRLTTNAVKGYGRVIPYGSWREGGNFAAIVGNLAVELHRLDRYERRALSRRRQAIEEFVALGTVSSRPA
jgi:hypothetical protein